MLLTIQLWFWIFPNLGTKSCCTTLFLLRIISQCQTRSHCWCTVLFDWWNVVILSNPLGWATAGYQGSQRALICEITSFPDLDTLAAADPDIMFSGYTASLRSKTDNGETCQQHRKPGFAAQQYFFSHFPGSSFNLSWLRVPDITHRIRQPGGLKTDSE